MAQYNIGAFNQAGYNLLSEETSVVKLYAFCYNTWNAEINAQERIYATSEFKEKISTPDKMEILTAWVITPTQDPSTAFTSGGFNGIIYVYNQADCESSFSAPNQTIVSKNDILYDHDDLTSQFEKGAFDIVSINTLKGDFKSLITSDTMSIGSDNYIKATASNLWLGALDPVMAIKTRVIKVDVNLEPGQKLVIDADDYEVSINGENMLHKHSGEWLDELNRNTLSVDVQGTGGSCRTLIFYTERYL